MICYIDTSALVKKYLDEPGSGEVVKILSETIHLFTSALTELELIAALDRAKRNRRLNSPAYRDCVKISTRQFEEGTVGLIPMDSSIHSAAKRLIRQRGLTAPDSIQLASALATQKDSRGELEFICADHTLLEAARLEGLKCQDVSSNQKK